MDIYLPTVFLLMDSIKKLYSTLFQHSFKRSVYVVAGLIIALSLPVTIFLAQQQQDLRQRAYSPNEGTTSYNSGSSCYSYNNRGTGCSCTSSSQCSSRNCSGYNNVQKTCQGTAPTPTLTPILTPTPTGVNTTPTSYPSPTSTYGGIYGNCSSSTSRGTYCGCTTSSQCASASCISFGSTGYKYCAPGGSITPTPTLACGLTGRPSGCSCQLTTQCQQGLSCTSGKCTGSTTPTPTNTPSPTPTPTPVDMCTATTNRPQACSCTASSQCRSGLCSGSKCSPQPTEAVAQGSTGLNFSVNLPGIAQKLATNEDNSNPVNTSRLATIQIFDSSNTSALQGISKKSLAFNTTTYRFEGAIDLGTSFATGNYTLKLGLDNTLKKQLGGILTITQGSASNTAALTQLVPGDIDQNNSIDILDYNSFIACYKNLPICTADLSSLSDLNDNGTIDILDLNILQRGFSVRNGD